MKHDIRTVEYNMSLEEIAQHLGLTRERVRQIQNEALVKLRDGLAERVYTAKDFLQVLGMKADQDTEEFICNLKRTKDH
jgi:predicted transcriptional regulator